MEEKPHALSMWKYSMGGFVGVIILNVIAYQVLKLKGSAASFAIALTVGFVALWFVKSEKRTPMPTERSRFLWQYGVATALLFFLPLLLILRVQPLTMWTPLIVFIHWGAYLLGAYYYLSDKYMGRQMKKLLPKSVVH